MSNVADTPSSSVLEASFVAEAGRTRLDRVFERGALRLRLPRGPRCEGIIVNTGGGIVAGDRIALDLAVGPDAALTATTVAAEKIYRSEGPTSDIATRLRLADGASLDWLPQETILFDGGRLKRSFTVDMPKSARLLAAETIVFGRLASREAHTSGHLSDSWRVRRDGRLVFADESRLDGAIGAMLDRPAVADGARAAALLIFVAADAEERVDRLRAAFDPFVEGEDSARVATGVSARDGFLTARLLSRAPDRLAHALVEALACVRTAPLPRSWS